MGLILPQKITVSWNGANKQHFVSKGYTFTKLFDEFEVDVLELLSGSNYKVLIQCDYCQKIYPYPYSKYIRTMEKGSVGKISCDEKECRKQYKEDSIVSSNQRFSLEEVQELFKQYDCVFLENQYKGYTENHHFQCSCGKEDTITMTTFKNQRQWCRECSVRKRGQAHKHDLETVQKIYTDKGCELLEKEYFNNNTIMKYKCTCQRIGYKTLNAFQLSTLCEQCVKESYIKRGDSRRYKQSEVEKIFKKEGYTLTSNYVSFHEKMSFICPNQHSHKISLAKFLSGKRCKFCYLENNKGENNPAYNPNKTDEERIYGRIVPGYKEWKKECLKRDNWTCQCCRKRGGTLHVHHIYNYSQFPQYRVLLENGISLCYNCHKGKNGFHGVYGNYHNRVDEFLEFVKSTFSNKEKGIKFLQKLNESISN